MEKYSTLISKKLDEIVFTAPKNNNKKSNKQFFSKEIIQPTLMFDFQVQPVLNGPVYQARGNTFAYAITNQQASAKLLLFALNCSELGYDTPFEISTDNKTYNYHPVAYCLTYSYKDLLNIFFELPDINWANITMPVNHRNNGNTIYTPIIFSFIRSDLETFKKALTKYKDISFFEKHKTNNLLIEIINLYGHDETLCLEYLKAALSNFKQPARLINLKLEISNPFSKTTLEKYPLFCATELGLIKVIELFMSQPDIKLHINSSFITLATVAAEANNLDLFRYLHEKKYINPKQVGRALHVACLLGCYELVDFMLEHGYQKYAPNQAGPYLKESFEISNKFILNNAETPLQIAVMRGHLDIAALLLKKGKISIDEIDGLNKRSAIFAAIDEGKLDKSTLYLQERSEEENQEQNSNNSLSSDSESDQEFLEDISSLEWCLQHGANLNLVDKNGMTPLIYAIDRNAATHVCKKLIVAGARLDITNDFNQTPLIMAVIRSNQETVAELCSKLTCDLHACDWRGFTAFDYALFLPNQNILKLLVDNITKPKKKKKTLLYLLHVLENLSNQNPNLTFLKTELNKLDTNIVNNPHPFFSVKSLKKIAPVIDSVNEFSELQRLFNNPTWFNSRLAVTNEYNLKPIRKTVNCYLYLSEELIRQQATQQNYANTERLDSLFKEPYPKFLHALNEKNNYSLQIEIDHHHFTASLSQEIYVDGKARILVFAIPEKYKDDKTQRGTLYMGIFSKNGLHDQGDINNLLSSNKTIKIALPQLAAQQDTQDKPLTCVPKNNMG